MSIDRELLDLWWHHEELAMHFNELLMQYRLNLLGGSSLIGVLATYFIGKRVEDPAMRHRMRAIIATILLLLIVATAGLDVFYYNELLHGTVDAVLELEKQHPDLFLSTRIEARFRHVPSTYVVYFVYLAVCTPVVILVVYSWVVMVRDPGRAKLASRSCDATPTGKDGANSSGEDGAATQ
jgi:hypothetical protein